MAGKKSSPKATKTRIIKMTPWRFSLLLHSVVIIGAYIAYLAHIVNQLPSIGPISDVTINIEAMTKKQEKKEVMKTKKYLEKMKLPYTKKTIDEAEKNYQTMDRKKAQEMLKNTKNMASKIKNQVKEFDKLQKTHKIMVTPSGQQEILDLLGKNFSDKDYVPKRENADFNWKDFTIYQIKKIPPDGYEIIFVDRQGRIIKEIYKGQAARLYDNLYRVYNLCQQNKMLKPLLDYTLKTIPVFLEKN